MPSDKRNDNAPAELAEIRRQFKPIEALVLFVPVKDDPGSCEGCVAEHDLNLCDSLPNCDGGVFKLEVGR